MMLKKTGPIVSQSEELSQMPRCPSCICETGSLTKSEKWMAVQAQQRLSGAKNLALIGPRSGDFVVVQRWQW